MSSTGRTQGTPQSFLGRLTSSQKAPEPELTLAPAEAQGTAKPEAAPAAESQTPTASDSYKTASPPVQSQPAQFAGQIGQVTNKLAKQSLAQSRVPAQKQASPGAQQLKGKSGVPGKAAMAKKAPSAVSAPDQSIWAALAGQAASAKKGENLSPVASERTQESAVKELGPGVGQTPATGPVAEAAKDAGPQPLPVAEAAKHASPVQASVAEAAKHASPVQVSVAEAAKDAGPAAGPDPASPKTPQSVGAPMATAPLSAAEPIGAAPPAASQLPGGVLPLPQSADIFATENVRQARESFDAVVAKAFQVGFRAPGEGFSTGGLRAEDRDAINAAGQSLTDARKLAASGNLEKVVNEAIADGQVSGAETAQLLAATLKIKEAAEIAPPVSTEDLGASRTNAKLLLDAAKDDFDKLFPGGLTGDTLMNLTPKDSQLLSATLANMKFATNSVAIEDAREAYEKAKTAALSDGHISPDEFSDFNAKQTSIQNLCGQSKALMAAVTRSYAGVRASSPPPEPERAASTPVDPKPGAFPAFESLDPRLGFYARLPAPVQFGLSLQATSPASPPPLTPMFGVVPLGSGMPDLLQGLGTNVGVLQTKDLNHE